jgi:hypothetical protein
MPTVKTVEEFHPLQMIHSEVMKMRKANRIIDVVEITEEEYVQIQNYLGLKDDQHIPTIPPSGTYFEIVRKDGTKYNPVEEAKNRKVKIASAADEVFKQ